MKAPKTFPDFTIESEYCGVIVGVDEAGRGPLCGPVIAAAAILKKDALGLGINDSKKLSAKKREELFEHICQNYIVSVGLASVAEIDELNILNATMLAMTRALEGIGSYDFALIDGNKTPFKSEKLISVIGGDAKSISIAAASIVAKVTRDRILLDMDKEYPHYLWRKNSGYGTKAHIAAIHEFGQTPHHRKKFIHKIIHKD